MSYFGDGYEAARRVPWSRRVRLLLQEQERRNSENSRWARFFAKLFGATLHE